MRAKYDRVMRDRVFLWSMPQLKAIRGEFGEDLNHDFLMLKERLQVSTPVLFMTRLT